MFIQTEQTPNPNSLKFLLEENITNSPMVEFQSPQEAENHPFILKLFSIQGVDSVFIGDSF